MDDSVHSKKLHRWVDPNSNRAGYRYWCQGCESYHSLVTSEGGWGFNGNIDSPTFTPSVLVRNGHYAAHFKVDSDNCWCKFNEEMKARGDKPSGFKCIICHTFITDGIVMFLNDCSHKFAGQSHPLPDYPIE